MTDTKPSTVYFCPRITADNLVKVYQALGREAKGRVAIKLSTGEAGNPNHLSTDVIKRLVHLVEGTIVACNTAYEGRRCNVADHLQTAAEHGFTAIAEVDIMDAQGDIALPVRRGKHLKENYVGRNWLDYDFTIVLSHFKGHPMGGFGGALKNISIGIASSRGKQYIHGAGDMDKFWDADHDAFLESMADAAWSIHDRFQGRVAYLNVMKNMSVDCDCCAVAADPKIGDIGILASLDPVALDQACLDLVYASNDPGKADLIERIESRNGVHTVEAAAQLGIGTREYELISLS